MESFRRIVCIVLDGVGAGEAPDATDYGDTGSHSLANTARAVGGLRLPNLARMGLGNITDIAGVAPAVSSSAHFGIMAPAAAGKDSTTGHWELMGCVLEVPLPVYPDGFPADLIRSFEDTIGSPVIGNCAASGTEIIRDLGASHMETGRPIVYTSQDSVFQIAAHEDTIPLARLYEICEIARRLLVPPNGVGRVIARPFRGAAGSCHRTADRRDFSIPPPEATVLDMLSARGIRVHTIGKVDDLFGGRGIHTAEHTVDNRDGMARTLTALAEDGEGFLFVNLVDFDTMWGHRNDARAYALGLEDFDSYLSELLPALSDDDLLIVTSDHGNDPTTRGTDHSRENVPLLVYHRRVRVGHSLGVRESFADVGATVAHALGAPPPAAGTSFLDDCR